MVSHADKTSRVRATWVEGGIPSSIAPVVMEIGMKMLLEKVLMIECMLLAGYSLMIHQPFDLLLRLHAW